MVNTFSGWLFNVILWGSVVSLILLLIETSSQGFIIDEINQIRALIGAAVIAVLALWPRF